MSLITVDALGKSFDDGRGQRWILRNLSLAVGCGERLVLWGPSGSGKSTLLGLIAGNLLPEEGSVVFDHDGRFVVSSASERERTDYRRRHLGYIFQFFNLIPTLRVGENVLLPIEINGLGERSKEALERLDVLGVADRIDDYPDTLSGGEQQRVAIARALAHAPPLVLADEPTGNLDARNARVVIDLLWRESERSGAALIVATHNERIAARADAVIELP